MLVLVSAFFYGSKISTQRSIKPYNNNTFFEHEVCFFCAYCAEISVIQPTALALSRLLYRGFKVCPSAVCQSVPLWSEV